MRVVFDDARARSVLVPAGIEAPPLRDYFPKLMDYAEAARWGKQQDDARGRPRAARGARRDLSSKRHEPGYVRGVGTRGTTDESGFGLRGRAGARERELGLARGAAAGVQSVPPAAACRAAAVPGRLPAPCRRCRRRGAAARPGDPCAVPAAGRAASA